MSAQHPVLLRAATEKDVPFILDSWLSSHRKSYHVRGIEGPIYYSEQRKVCETLLPRCTVLMACDAHYPTSLFGYVVAEEVDSFLVIHWIYLREGFRDLGIGTKLVETLLGPDPEVVALVYTHQTKAGRKWERKMFDKMPMTKHNGRMPVIYNPYFLYKTLGAGWANS